MSGSLWEPALFLALPVAIAALVGVHYIEKAKQERKAMAFVVVLVVGFGIAWAVRR